MKTVKLKTISGKPVLINWNNVDFVTSTSNHFGDNYSEVHCGDQIVDVKETIQEIESLVGGTDSLALLEEEFKQQYNECSGTVTEKLQ
jgi:hypothetical protein